MTSREDVLALIEEAYAARDRGDADAAAKTFHADASFGLAGDKSALTLTGLARGQPNIRDALSGFIENFEFQNREILQIIIDGDRAAVNSRLKIRYVPKNTTFTSEVLDVIHIKDGKIFQLVEFADTAFIRDLIS